MNAKDLLKISLLCFAIISSINCELQELIRKAYLRSHELEEIINKQEALIANLSKIIEDQKGDIAYQPGKFAKFSRGQC